MKILNLYAGIGGNRKLWSGCDVTAVEIVPEIVEVYQVLYPQDTVIIDDAHKFLEQHYNEYDFIWSSPPCPSHGQYRHNVGVIGKGFNPIMPDMRLYGEIVFLQTYFEGKWVVENVRPYYDYLIKPNAELSRHVFWSNFKIAKKEFKKCNIRSKNKISDFDDGHIVAGSSIKNKRQVLRNMIDAKLGLHILQESMEQQTKLFGGGEK